MKKANLEDAAILRGAVFHAVYDEKCRSVLAGLELPDRDFKKEPDREKAMTYLESQIANVRRCFTYVWESEHGEESR